MLNNAIDGKRGQTFRTVRIRANEDTTLTIQAICTITKPVSARVRLVLSTVHKSKENEMENLNSEFQSLIARNWTFADTVEAFIVQRDAFIADAVDSLCGYVESIGNGGNQAWL